MDGSAIDLTILVERLRTAGFRVDTRQYLSAHEMLLAFAARGRRLEDDVGVLASHLGPIFCTLPEEQARFVDEIRAWCSDRLPVPIDAPHNGGPPPFDFWRRSRRRLILAALGIPLFAVAVVLLFREFRPVITEYSQVMGAKAPQGTLATDSPQADVASGPPWKTIAFGFALATLTSLGLFALVGTAKRRLALQRLAATGDADDATLTPHAAAAVTITDHELRRLASAWRRPREQTAVELDAAATVRATLQAGGLFVPVYAARRAMPEYLALVHRSSGDDHWAEWVDEWLFRLAATGVVVEVMTFHDDPRTCYTSDERRRAHRLSELVAHHHRATVLLFAETSVFFNPLQGALHPWVGSLSPLSGRVVFTPEPPFRWGPREWMLAAEGFVVLPAGAVGFRSFGEIAGDWRAERMFPAPYARAYPTLIVDEPSRWLDRNPPDDDLAEELVRQLRGYLGPDGFAWLCGCAVYPQISLPLTLHLAEPCVLASIDASASRSAVDLLPGLARLPWLRYGFMPDWLRVSLITRMTPKQNAAVRRSIESLLERLALMAASQAPRSAGAEPKRAKGPSLSISRWLGPMDLLRAAPASSPLADRVFLGFMAGASADPLSFGVSDALRKLFSRAVGELPGRAETMSTASRPAAIPQQPTFEHERKKVIFASSLGTIFEWYDFYLYATLAPFFAPLFFPRGNDTAALLSAFATYAAGYLMRPIGALVFGRIGDLVGRKYLFAVTVLIMGFSTIMVGLLPTYVSIGWAAPILLLSLRLLQGLAIGGEYGGAVTYVAEHATEGKRGYDTAWIQTTATLAFFLALLVIGFCRFTGWLTPTEFSDWGWRLPFLVSLILLIFSIYIRLKLNESPMFQRMKAEGKGSKAPLTDSFLKYPNYKYVLLALLGVTAGQGVVWYTGQFYTLYFLTITLKVNGVTAYTMIAIALLLGTPFFIFFGWLSDKIGRLKIILAGCVIAALTYFPLFHALTHYVNPALEKFRAVNVITVQAKDCYFQMFIGPWSRFSDCDKAKDYLTKAGLSFTSTDLPGSSADTVVTKVGDTELKGYNEVQYKKALADLGYPAAADTSAINWPMTLLILWVMVMYAAMVYGPIGAYLVELFPTRIRCTSVSLSYHIGNGWFGGILPLATTAMVAATGDIYYGLWYPIVVAVMTPIIGSLFLSETSNRDISTYDHTVGSVRPQA